MILELPDIRDTVCGQELIAEGKAEGEVHQLRDKLRVFATRKFGPLPSEVSANIQKLDLPQGDELFDRLFDMLEIGDLQRWLSEHAS